MQKYDTAVQRHEETYIELPSRRLNAAGVWRTRGCCPPISQTSTISKRIGTSCPSNWSHRKAPLRIRRRL